MVAAHCDDETLGAGGLLWWAAQCGAPTTVMICADDTGNESRSETRRAHAEKARQILGVESLEFLGMRDRYLANDIPALARRIEFAIDRLEPDIVLTHNNVDPHQDHRAVFEATMIATRPATRRTARTVLAYEVPSGTEQVFPTTRTFCPSLFVEIGQPGMAAKLRALRCYRTEIRRYPHPRSTRFVRAHAERRAIECGACGQFVEAFQTLREVTDADSFHRTPTTLSAERSVSA